MDIRDIASQILIAEELAALTGGKPDSFQKYARRHPEKKGKTWLFWKLDWEGAQAPQPPDELPEEARRVRIPHLSRAR